MAGAGLLLLAAAGASPSAATDPAAFSEPGVMIVEYRRQARMVGFPAVCPGDPPNLPPDDGLCMAELYEGPARVIRHLAGPPARLPGPLRLTAHARRWPAGTRLLVIARPFEDGGVKGTFAFWWQQPGRDGDFCLGKQQIERLPEGPLRSVFLQENRRRFQADAKDDGDFCIPG